MYVCDINRIIRNETLYPNVFMLRNSQVFILRNSQGFVIFKMCAFISIIIAKKLIKPY